MDITILTSRIAELFEELDLHEIEYTHSLHLRLV